VNIKKIFILLFALTIYVNYVMHFQKDVSKLERKIVNIEHRIIKEEKLFEEKSQYKDINSSKEYGYLFYDGTKLSYSEAMGLFQQNIQSFAQESNCTIINSQWQDMPMNKDIWYDILSLRVSLECKPKAFISFQNHARLKKKLFIFNQLKLFKDRRKNFLRITTIISAYRSKKDEN